jgi:hypothetical protein
MQNSFLENLERANLNIASPSPFLKRKTGKNKSYEYGGNATA